MRIKKTLILMILILAPLVFSQTLPQDFFRQYSKSASEDNGINFSPYDYKYIGKGKFSGDSVIIYALRVEFRPDSVVNTTGNGLFMRRDADNHQKSTDSISPGMRLSRTDKKEFEWYRKTYEYDNLPHDSTYFDEHLTALRNYYLEVSNEKIKIGSEIFPSGAFGSFRLDNEIGSYSPGNKRRNESNDDYGLRRSRALMRFVAQSINMADKSENSPFKNLQRDSKGRLCNENGVPVFILLIHAGSSGLTDGGTGSTGNADSPSDFQDVFVTEEWFKFFGSSQSQENNFGAIIEKDSVSGKTGAKVKGKDGDIYLSELMMVSETANQDSLNWGINGILVNQFARQIGVPDLYSTSSGTTGIGSFGIMDFAGYSAAQGFIPPNPSAFIRSYMGWSEPILAKHGDICTLSVSKNNLYLAPINNSEYYLIENRQRNLTGYPDVFVYDTLNGNQYISSGFQLNLERCVDSFSNVRKVILKIKSQSRDVGIPASGACVWHVDEKLIDNRIKYNSLNGDSSYRAVSLKEADGVVDIGVEFTNTLGYPWYDYGSAADVFPHVNNFLSTNKPPLLVDSMSPTTTPSTAANDGGNSYLKLSFENSDTFKKEIYYYSKASKGDYESYSVTNYSDSVIYMSVSLDNNYLSPKFSVRVKGDGFYPLLTADVFKDGNGGEKEIVTLSKDGYLSVISANGSVIIHEEKIADEIKNMPSFIDNNLFIPCKNKILIYNGEYAEIKKDSITGFDVSSYVVGLDDDSWAFGTNDGKLVFGSKKTVANSVSLDNRAITAVAEFKEKTAAAVSEKGGVFVVSKDGGKLCEYELLNAKYAFLPLKIAVSNDRIIISDGKQGLWFLTFFEDGGKTGIKQNENQREFPADWAGIFRERSGRGDIPENHGFLSMADLDGGGLRLLVGGTNGVYAFDEKGYLLENYPAVLDRADWYIRKSVLATPASAKNKKGETFVFFTTTTGDEKSYYQAKITKADANRGIVYFNDINGKPDSMSGFSKKYITDTLLSYNDSTILPYFAPGGLIDIRMGKTGKRPDLQIPTQNPGKNRIFPYLISIGEPLSQGVVLDNLSADGKELDLIAVSDNGTLYRFGLPDFSANQTDMTGGNAARRFNFKETAKEEKERDNTLEYFYSYPNPIKISKGDKGAVTFRYELGNGASSALLTIYTIQGQKVFEEKNLRASKGINEFVLNDLSRFGSAVYRCRLSVKFGGEEKVLFWKMAVLR